MTVLGIWLETEQNFKDFMQRIMFQLINPHITPAAHMTA